MWSIVLDAKLTSRRTKMECSPLSECIRRSIVTLETLFLYFVSDLLTEIYQKLTNDHFEFGRKLFRFDLSRLDFSRVFEYKLSQSGLGHVTLTLTLIPWRRGEKSRMGHLSWLDLRLLLTNVQSWANNMDKWAKQPHIWLLCTHAYKDPSPP